MNKKRTDELEKLLRSTSRFDINNFLEENKEEMLEDSKPFAAYMRQHIRSKGILWKDVFIQADVDEKFGYKIIEEEERTRQRDLIIRICYAAHFSVDEVCHALNIYQMSPLTPDIDRDAVLIIAFNRRPGSILEVNAMLRKYNLDPLRFYTGKTL